MFNIVRKVIGINTVVTSREAILKVCRELVSAEGLEALNMRSVAQNCRVALGSLYNYFPSKDELLLATVESVWKEIFHMEDCGVTETCFVNYVMWIFDRIQSGAAKYPNFFTSHSIGFAGLEKGRARQTMQACFEHIKAGMKRVLCSDTRVREGAFSDDFTVSAFVDFVFESLLTALIQHRTDCKVLLELVRRSLY